MFNSVCLAISLLWGATTCKEAALQLWSGTWHLPTQKLGSLFIIIIFFFLETTSLLAKLHQLLRPPRSKQAIKFWRPPHQDSVRTGSSSILQLCVISWDYAGYHKVSLPSHLLSRGAAAGGVSWGEIIQVWMTGCFLGNGGPEHDVKDHSFTRWLMPQCSLNQLWHENFDCCQKYMELRCIPTKKKKKKQQQILEFFSGIIY